MGACNPRNSQSKNIKVHRRSILNLPPLETHCTIIAGHTDSISELIELKDSRLCSASWDGTIKIWNKENIKNCDLTITNPNEESFLCVIQLNDETILCGDSENLIFNFSLQKKFPLHIFHGHNDAIYSLVQINQNEFASCSEDTIIIIWDIKSCESKNKLQGHNSKINKIILLNNGNLASCSNDCCIKIWDIKNQNNINCICTFDNDFCCMTITELKNGKIAGGYINKEIKIWDIEKKNVFLVLKGHDNYISVIYEYKNNEMISCSYDGIVIFWDLNNKNYKDNNFKVKNQRWHDGNISSVIMFHGGFASGGFDNLIKIWE